MKTFFILASFLVLTYGTDPQYRFDYEYSEDADGWLKYHEIPATWDDARLICHSEGAVLASPLSTDLKSAILSLLKQQRCPNDDGLTIFTGTHSIFSKGTYTSIEGVSLLNMVICWASGEPNNCDNEESCLSMTSDGDIADVRCSKVLPFVCYKKFEKLNFCKSCGTTDPGYVFEPKTGSCYKFHGSGLTWPEAFKTCVGEGGYLTVINNDVEAALVKNMYSKHPDSTITNTKCPGDLLIGFHDWYQYGTSFMTVFGNDLSSVYHTWSSGQPDNATTPRSGDPGQFCGAIFRNGQLDDVWCHVPFPFLCEKDPQSLLGSKTKCDK